MGRRPSRRDVLLAERMSEPEVWFLQDILHSGREGLLLMGDADHTFGEIFERRGFARVRDGRAYIAPKGRAKLRRIAAAMERPGGQRAAPARDQLRRQIRSASRRTR